MRNRLKRWWNVAPLWPICFSILFGRDVAKIDVSRSLDLYGLVEMFSEGGKAKVVYPEIMPVIAGMLKAGVGTVVSYQGDEGAKETSDEHGKLLPAPTVNGRFMPLSSQQGKEDGLLKLAGLFETYLRF